MDESGTTRPERESPLGATNARNLFALMSAALREERVRANVQADPTVVATQFGLEADAFVPVLQELPFILNAASERLEQSEAAIRSVAQAHAAALSSLNKDARTRPEKAIVAAYYFVQQ